MDLEEEFIKLSSNNTNEEVYIFSEEELEYINRGYQEHEPIDLQIK